MPSVSQTFNASGTFTWPPGVLWVTVEGWGPGGTGGPGTGNPATGSGGAGGAYAKKRFSRPSGGTDTVTVGTAPAPNALNTTSASNTGTDTSFRATDSTGLTAKAGPGGIGATANSSNGAAVNGSSSGCIGDAVFAGGNSAAGAFGTATGAGGGGAAGRDGAGGNASGATGGTAKDGGGSGANGPALSTAGSAGTAPGGGASGGNANSTTDRLGGQGGAGRILVTWETIDLNNYRSVTAGDGMSVAERVR